MKKFFLDRIRWFKETTIFKKILVILALIVYVATILVCTIHIDVEKTSPGDITRIESLIIVDGKDNSNMIYSVSVYTYTSITLLDYLISSINKEVEIERVNHQEDDITVNEIYKMNVCAKEQSIQDSIISAYEIASENGYDVSLSKQYLGVRVCYILANYYQTGPESLQIGDVVTQIRNVDIVSDEESDAMRKFRTEVEWFYQNKTIYQDQTCHVKVLRNGVEVELNNCSCKHLVLLGLISNSYGNENVYEYYFYDAYKINYSECNPKLNVKQPDSVGPSAGFIQTLYIYDCLTDGSILSNKRIIGTGTISTDGTVGKIGKITIEKMTEHFGTNPAEVLCGIAPSICRNCYEVSADVAEAFLDAFGPENRDVILKPSVFNPDDSDKYMLDLWAACKLVFLEAGVPEEHIEITDYCTRCNPDLFYSHRIMGANRGSLAAFISL